MNYDAVITVCLFSIVMTMWVTAETKVNSYSDRLVSCMNKADNCSGETELAELLKSFAENHTYINSTDAETANISRMNCVDYSEQIAPILEAKGYKVRQIDGCDTNNTRCHRWISIDIEPIWGKPVNYDLEYPDQTMDGTPLISWAGLLSWED